MYREAKKAMAKGKETKAAKQAKVGMGRVGAAGAARTGAVGIREETLDPFQLSTHHMELSIKLQNRCIAA